MTNSNDHTQESQQPLPDQGYEGTSHQVVARSPLDVVDTDKKPSYKETDLRQATRALADCLEPFEPDLVHALRLCADGLLNCNRRVCPRCSRARTIRLASRYKFSLNRMLAPHHLTLTSYPADSLTRTALNETRARFRLLRKRIKAEKRITVLGGVANIETDATDDGRWLVGLHAVIDAPVPPSTNWVRQAWQALGGGQQVCLDPIVRGTQGTVFAYSTKTPVIPHGLPMLRQFLTATRGHRATQPFGSLHPLAGKPPGRRARPVSESPASPTATPRTDKPPKSVFFKDLLKKDPVLRAEVRRLVASGRRDQAEGGAR